MVIDDIKYIHDYIFLTSIDIKRFVKTNRNSISSNTNLLSYDEISDIEINVLQSI